MIKESRLKPYYEKTFQRHKKDLKDVKNGKSNIRFNQKIGLAYIKIIENLKHYKGELAGQNIKLEDWQKKVIVIAFGWERLNLENKWVRRFNTVFIFIPRKNGKTLLASALAIADSIIRYEIGGEVVIFATKKKQAKLAWTGVEKMLLAHPELKKETKNSYGVLEIKKTETTFETLGRDSDTEDGSNPTIGIADEYHAHPDNSLYEVVESGQGARKQPLMLTITTGGFNTYSPAFNMHEYAMKVLEGAIEDDTFFGFVAQPDKNDDPFEESTWIKANPNYGISVSKDYMQRKAKDAQERPGTKNNFLVKNLNLWTNAAENFIQFEDWQACIGEIKTDGELVLGMDLSLTDDFSAVCNLYRDSGKYYATFKYYIPLETIHERARELKVPLESWVANGYITATPGRTIDYEYIIQDIDNTIIKSEALCYDAYKAKVIINKLEDDGFENSIPITQGFLSLSAPTNYLLKLVKDKNIVHDNNPVTNWMISNLSILTDAAGNIKPNKSDLNRKIDGIAALINAIAYFETVGNKTVISPYESRGMRSL